MNTVICVAVRLKSQRLPRKAFADLAGKPLILRLTERVKEVAPVVWCTSWLDDDLPLIQLADRLGISYFAGDPMDVMSRFLDVATIHNADTIVRVTGDNPLTDPHMMRAMLEEHTADYTYTLGPPRGTKSEIINVGALRKLYHLIDPSKSEYMTTQLHLLEHKACIPFPDVEDPELRLTVDTAEDLARVQAIYEAGMHTRPLPEIIQWTRAFEASSYAGEQE